MKCINHKLNYLDVTNMNTFISSKSGFVLACKFFSDDGKLDFGFRENYISLKLF